MIYVRLDFELIFNNLLLSFSHSWTVLMGKHRSNNWLAVGRHVKVESVWRTTSLRLTEKACHDMRPTMPLLKDNIIPSYPCFCTHASDRKNDWLSIILFYRCYIHRIMQFLHHGHHRRGYIQFPLHNVHIRSVIAPNKPLVRKCIQ